ncbi:hypothetical protein PCO82_21845 [Pectobacteriaceae bacterium CE90]|nr:hypothetical protein PCO82_21845 [Pectobacteriaceae bacterium CE90]
MYCMKKLFISACLLVSGLAHASGSLLNIQKQWAICEYRTLSSQQDNCFSILGSEVQGLVSSQPTNAKYLIWSAIVDSSWAGTKGGLGALSLVKKAKGTLEKAIALDPNALEGSAYTSLGVLYYRVPGWPIGFGDDKKAEQYLQTALKMNPSGIDPNYFYGDYLLKQGNKKEAKQYLSIALAAAPRAGREIADQGRKDDIQKDLALLKK